MTTVMKVVWCVQSTLYIHRIISTNVFKVCVQSDSFSTCSLYTVSHSKHSHYKCNIYHFTNGSWLWLHTSWYSPHMQNKLVKNNQRLLSPRTQMTLCNQHHWVMGTISNSDRSPGKTARGAAGLFPFDWQVTWLQSLRSEAKASSW